MTEPERYTKHLDTVLALVSNLGLTTKEGRTMRSASALIEEVFGKGANGDDLLRREIQGTLDAFPGLFRKVTAKDKRIVYTLHLRWAMAQGLDPDSQSPPLTADLLQALLDFVSKRAEAEATEKQFRENIKTTQDQFRENIEATQNQFRE